MNVVYILLLVLCSAFFAASETAYTTVNPVRLRRKAESGSKVAVIANYIYENFDQAISAILIGNNLVNIAASSLATVVFVGLMGESGAAVASIAMTIIILLFGEIMPKILAKEMCDGMVKLFAYPLRAMMLVLTPLVRGIVFLVDMIASALLPVRAVVPSMTEQEFSAILDKVEDEGIIDEDRGELLQSALTFDETSIEEVMTPRVDMFSLDVSSPVSELVREIMESGYSRIPVYEDTIDHIIGILHVNRFLESMVQGSGVNPRDYLMESMFLHKTMTLDDALKKMRKARIHIAIVIDEYGGTLGMITMEDMFEELVGEIWDEGDDVVMGIVELSGSDYECSGNLSIREFFDYIDYDPFDFESEYVTLGGWATEMLDAEPEVNKAFYYEQLLVTVAKMNGPRVTKLIIHVDEPDDGD